MCVCVSHVNTQETEALLSKGLVFCECVELSLFPLFIDLFVCVHVYVCGQNVLSWLMS